MTRIAFLAAAGLLALTSAASAVQAPLTPRAAQPAPTQCQAANADCAVVLSKCSYF